MGVKESGMCTHLFACLNSITPEHKLMKFYVCGPSDLQGQFSSHRSLDPRTMLSGRSIVQRVVKSVMDDTFPIMSATNREKRSVVVNQFLYEQWIHCRLSSGILCHLVRKSSNVWN
jgi:hypothetical protein